MRNLVIGLTVGLLIGASGVAAQVTYPFLRDNARWIGDEAGVANRPLDSPERLLIETLHVGYATGVIDTLDSIAIFNIRADARHEGHMDLIQLQKREVTCLARSNIRTPGDVKDFAARAIRSSPFPTNDSAAMSILAAFNNCGQ